MSGWLRFRLTGGLGGLPGAAPAGPDLDPGAGRNRRRLGDGHQERAAQNLLSFAPRRPLFDAPLSLALFIDEAGDNA